MNKITIQDIRDLRPCYDPSRYLPEEWTGTVEDILLIEECPSNDRIWVAVRLVPRFIAECFAIDCAVSAQFVSDASSDASSDAAADAASDAAAYAAAYTAACAAAADAAAADAAAAYAIVRKQERENQIDALLMLLGGDDD